ncbi:DUF580-domain-containing protein [Wilcoxina mikolae CBS 423.85]|nr:DUF580-domain-containing protein [Wilcoxina mikolae CBS 423.85]
MANNYYPPPTHPPPPSKQVYGGYQPQPQPTYGGASSQQPPFPQYQQPPPVNYNQQQPAYSDGPKYPNPNEPPPPYTFEQKFTVAKPKYNDLWAAILFLVDFFGLVVVSGISLNAYRATKKTNGNGIYDDRSNTFGLSTNTIILFVFVLAVAFATSGVYFWIARTFTKKLIYITAILNIVLGIGTAIYYFSRSYYSAAIVFLIFSVFYIFCFWSWRFRIPFSVLMLQTAIDVSKHFGHVFMVSAIGGVVALCAGAWFAVTFVAVYIKYSPSPDNPACRVNRGSCSSGKLIGLLVFVVFSFYWLSEVIKNVMHVSVSGVYGSWYFCARSQMPSHPTLGAFKRAMTYSFGSICFGSLIVSIIQLLKQAASIAQQDEAMDGNLVACCLWAVANCILSIILWLIEYFNHYAYSYIALYGDPYITAAKSTWTMMKDRGLDALVNDLLIDPVLTAGAVFVGYLCALLAWLYLEFTNPLYNEGGRFTAVVLAFAFLTGLQIANIFLVPIKSGIATIFTSMAHDPDVMRRDHPDLYQRMVAVYPHVQQMIAA